MLNSINIGTSGLLGFSKQLETISNNVANLNTAGFKGANAQFSALFSAGGESIGTGQAGTHNGAGLATLPTVVDFSQGQINQTGNDLDVAIDGNGFFILKDDAGNPTYTRDGRFNFDAKGVLVNAAGARVQQLSADGELKDITLEGLRNNPAQATLNIKMSGTLPLTETTKTVTGINVTDGAGATRALTVELKNNTAVTAGSWLVTIKDGATSVGSGEIGFINGRIDPAHSSVAFNYTPAGAAAMPLTLAFDASVTSPATGTATMAVSAVDGWGEGELTGATFDTGGKLVISYSNGQSSKDQRLALAHVNTATDLEQVGGNTFRSTNPQGVKLGLAGGAGSAITSKSVEGSNVDLSKEFSAIIVTQRGYQAASELISTANQMLDTLMHMKG
jgi:flagellar hook protein FlgE